MGEDQRDVKTAIIGVGSPVMGDDAAGIKVAEILQKKYKNKTRTVRVYIGNTAPENFTGEIRRFKPDRLIIVDAADLGEKPGSVMRIDPEVIGGVTFSSHTLPLKILADYIRKEVGCEIIVYGIQPLHIEYCANISEEVKTAVNDTVSMIAEEFL
jgi:hydrogenase 3 maturation protease